MDLHIWDDTGDWPENTCDLTAIESGYDALPDGASLGEWIAAATAEIESDIESDYDADMYGGRGIRVQWLLSDDDGNTLASGSVDCEPPDDADDAIDALLPRWGRSDDEQAIADCSHDWTSEGEGGCDENPGVWSLGGTAMSFSSHCRHCGVRRVEYDPGCQRNHGEFREVRYELP